MPGRRPSLTISPPEARSPWLNSFRNLGLALILASGWTALEWVRGWMFSGWGWNGLGVPLHDVLPIIQIAEITGVAGLSFVVAFANVIGVATVRRFTIESRIRVRRPHYDFTLTLAGDRRPLRLRHSPTADAGRDGAAAGRGGAGQHSARGKIQPRNSRRKFSSNSIA